MPIEFDLSPYLNYYFIETGLGECEGVKKAIDAGFKKIYSIEVHEPNYLSGLNLLKNHIDSGLVELMLGDSIDVLPHLLRNIKKRATFWLDAHGGYDGTGIGAKICPLYDELSAIGSHSIKTHTIMIDDVGLWGHDYSTWGQTVDKDLITSKIREINLAYEITFAAGARGARDVLIARVPDGGQPKRRLQFLNRRYRRYIPIL